MPVLPISPGACGYARCVAVTMPLPAGVLFSAYLHDDVRAVRARTHLPASVRTPLGCNRGLTASSRPAQESLPLDRRHLAIAVGIRAPEGARELRHAFTRFG